MLAIFVIIGECPVFRTFHRMLDNIRKVILYPTTNSTRQYSVYIRSKEPHDMEKHMDLHERDNTYPCQVAGCDYEVRSLQNLHSHYRVKHGVRTLLVCLHFLLPVLISFFYCYLLLCFGEFNYKISN